MLELLNDNTKFCALGELPQYDKTSAIERNLQSLLLRLKKSNQIDDELYNKIRPTGSERPRMYGLPKIHKEGAPLRPILSMVKSAQHSLAKELSLLLKPVLDKFSSRVIKDSFTFVNELRALNVNTSNLTICSFDVVSLFTNIPLDETIKICVDTLYHTDITPPKISEDAFVELMTTATKGVEFSFGNTVFKQIDGVAMGSPLGPVLANIFVGYYETKLFGSASEVLPVWYKRYVDDTFVIFSDLTSVDIFLELLNGLHTSLKFTCELENQDQLPFLDVLIHKEDAGFSTSVYRKPTFTGLYTRFDSFSSGRLKLSLVRCLIDRTYKISSERHLQKDLDELKSIFLSNGYPGRLLDRLFNQDFGKNKFIGPSKCPVYLKLPWIGQVSEQFEKSLKLITEKTFFTARLVCIFSSKTILPPTHKESLPAFSSSYVIYEFKCECDSRYVGRTTQRLSDRIKQHVPSAIRNKTVPLRQQPLRHCRSDLPITCNSAIGKHLLSSKPCADAYSNSNFRILSKCRSALQLKIMESVYIKLNDPDLCRQKEFVFNLALL